MGDWELLEVEVAETEPDADDARNRLDEFRSVLTEQLEVGQALLARAGEALDQLDTARLTANGVCRMAELGSALINVALEKLQDLDAKDGTDAWSQIAAALDPHPTDAGNR